MSVILTVPVLSTDQHYSIAMQSAVVAMVPLSVRLSVCHAWYINLQIVVIAFANKLHHCISKGRKLYIYRNMKPSLMDSPTPPLLTKSRGWSWLREAVYFGHGASYH